MRFLAVIVLAFLLPTKVTGQELRVKLNLWKYEDQSPKGIFITARNLVTDSSFSTSANEHGEFIIDPQKAGLYQVWVTGIAEPDTTFNITLAKDSISRIVIDYPPRICPYDKTRHSKECPIGGHVDNIIPIVYGLPTNSTFRRAKRNEVYLGGCIISDCDPNWYCTTHKMTF